MQPCAERDRVIVENRHLRAVAVAVLGPADLEARRLCTGSQLVSQPHDVGKTGDLVDLLQQPQAGDSGVGGWNGRGPGSNRRASLG